MKLEMSVTKKQVLLFLAFGLIPAAVIGVFALSGTGEIRQSQGTRLGEHAESLGDKIDRNLFERYGDVLAFAASDAARSGDPARIAAFMNTMIGIYAPVYDVMLAVDRDGRPIAVNGVDKAGKPIDASGLLRRNFAADPWFQRVIAADYKVGTSVVEDLTIDAEIGRIVGSDGGVMPFSAPIIDVDGRVVGVIFASSETDPETGYALTPRTVAKAATTGLTATKPVPTGSCALK